MRKRARWFRPFHLRGAVSAGVLVVAAAGIGMTGVTAGAPAAGAASTSVTPTVVTIAGDGGLGYSGDGGPATQAEVYRPVDAVPDGHGDFVITDAGDSSTGIGVAIRLVDSTGTITTLAGNGTPGYSGDGGPATQAQLNGADEVAIDAHGNVLIADSNNGVIRARANQTGTFYGQSMTAGDIYTIAGNYANLDTYAGDGGPATQAGLFFPSGVAIDAAGNVLIADSNNNRVRVVAATTGTFYGQSMTAGDIYTAYNFSSVFDAPYAVAVDGAGNLLISMFDNVYILAEATGTYYGINMTAGDLYAVFAGSGTCGALTGGTPASGAYMCYGTQTAVSVDRYGNLLVGNSDYHEVLAVASSTGSYYGQNMQAGDVYVIAGTGTQGFSGDGGPSTSAEFNAPSAVRVDPSTGDPIVSDTGNNRVRELQIPPPPSVSTVTPASSPIGGGGTVTITGAAFTGATSVLFGTVPATTFTVVSDTEISVVVPSASAPGRVDVTVAGPTGTSTATTGDGFLYVEAGDYTPVSPYRVLDTRCAATPQPSYCSSEGLPPSNAALATLGAQGTISVQVAGTGTGADSVPASAEAVVVNVTSVDENAATYLTVFPTGTAQPLASSLNLSPTDVATKAAVPNLAEVALGQGGALDVYNNAGSVDVIIDVEGYVAVGTGAGFVPSSPTRICDTRPTSVSGTTDPCTGNTQSTGTTLTVPVAGYANIPATASAVVVNLTVTGTTAAGYLTAWPTGATQPLASSLNWTSGETVANRVTVPIGSNGTISIFNSQGSTDVIVDVDGWFTPGTGAAFTPSSPVRTCDTRPSTVSGITDACTGHTLGVGGTLTITGAGLGGVPANATAVVVNMTVTNTTTASYLTAWPDGTAQPLASDLNWAAGWTRANLGVVALGSNGNYDVFNHEGGADVILDIAGWYS